MKKHKLIATTILALTLFQSATAYDLLISTNHFDVVFEGSTISETLQNFIVADVQRCYDAWGTNVVFHPGSPGIYDPCLTRKVFMGPYGDSELPFPRSFTTNAIGQQALKISPLLIQKYAVAYDFKTNNLDKVLAADAFVDFLSSPEFTNVTSNQVSNFILYKTLTPQDYIDSGEGILNDLSDQKFFYPSILGFYNYFEGPDATNLCASIPTLAKEQNSWTSYDVMPAIWHDGKWKISMWNWE